MAVDWPGHGDTTGQADEQGHVDRLVRLVGVVVAGEIILVLVGVALHPVALADPGGWAGLADVLLAQVGCAVLARSGPLAARRTPPAAWRTGVVVGVTVGLLYGIEGLAEYVSPALTGVSVAAGWVIVVVIVASHLVSGYRGAYRTGRTHDGVRAAGWNAIAEYLSWYPWVLTTYYLGAGSAAAARVQAAEGTLEDFHRSAMTSLEAFQTQDLWGAGLFHLLAALVLAATFGAAAAVVGGWWRGASAARSRPAGARTAGPAGRGFERSEPDRRTDLGGSDGPVHNGQTT